MNIKSRLEKLQKRIKPFDETTVLFPKLGDPCKFRRSDCPEGCAYDFPSVCWYKKRYPHRDIVVILDDLLEDEE